VKKNLLALAALLLGPLASLHVSAAPATTPPKAFGPVPTDRQMRWHELELYAFVHFTVNTFTDREWGFGDENPAIFNPTGFDADQIAAAAKAGGMKGLIFVAKHHDGLCLWPTKSTPHNISATPYKNGKGDMVKEMAEACKKADLKFAVYVSPWDRNHAEYGSPGYVTTFHQQIDEVTTQYGPIFEMWFDGANGGDGYYGGKGGRHQIDQNTYYRWMEVHAIIRKNQPDCAIWGGNYNEGGITHYGDCRWGGSEAGHVNDPCWPTVSSKKNQMTHSEVARGDRQGDVWCPAEGDVSIRPGWFWHEKENSRVKSPEKLMNIYLECVGRGANLIVNIPPDRRGLVHENDVASMTGFGKHLQATFATRLEQGATCTASHTRGNDASYGPANLLDADRWSAWITDDDVLTPEVTFTLPEARTFNLIRLREDIRLGQRIDGVAVDAMVDGMWKELSTASNVGAIRLLRVPQTTATQVRVRITKSAACPALSDFGLFLEPKFETWIPPIGAAPKVASTIKTKGGWKVVSASVGEAGAAIDGNPATFWNTHPVGKEHTLPQDFVVDMGSEKTLKGFTYLPRQDKFTHGMVDQYTFQISLDGKTWITAAEGEFGNLRANPIEQSVSFAPAKARYFKFIARHCLEMNHAIVPEIGVIE
jgi:alpha-L-fucosidase